MGKLEKFGRNLLRKLGGSRRRRGENATSSTSSSSDEEQAGVHKFQIIPAEDQNPPIRIGSPVASDEGSAGYATDDTALSSLSPLEIKRSSVDYSESQGYHSTTEVSPIPRILIFPEVPEKIPEPSRVPIYKKQPQDYPKINVAKRYKSSLALAPGFDLPKISIENKRKSATLADLTEDVDPIETFLKSSIYKTKMITTVFEGGFEEISTDVMHEIDRWFEAKNMMAVACEMHWSVPREHRKRQLESRLKDKLLNALRENNKRLLYLRGMGSGKTPVKLAESKTVENITRDRATDSVRGIYQRSYTRLLPYLHKETPEWHSQYWTLQDMEQDHPLQITASSSEDESLTSSTLLKIHVENLDDNEPEFLEGFSNLFQINENVTKPTAIGRLTAYDKDSKPIFYHILPTCGSEMSSNFSIDPEFGEIVFHPKTNPLGQKPVELCFLATSQRLNDVSEVFFDGTARNMRRVTVAFGEKDHPVSLHISGNQSISRIGDVLDRVEIPLLSSETNNGSDYNLKNLNFVPANYELGRDVNSPEGAVELNLKTGELVANGQILDTPQGVYTAEIERGAGNLAVKQLHHIRNDRKLRYVLAMSRNEFGANSEKLKRQILQAIGEKGKQLDVFFDEPMMDRKNSTWTSVCFYLTRDNAILDDKQMSSLVSSSNGHIAKLHHIFKVVNIDSCAPKPTSSPSTPSEIPLNTLILIGVVGLLIVALVALLTYVCCLSRYQRYLRQKTERMRMNSPGSYYKSPNLLPPPPGYIHTPPLPPPPPPAAIGFY